MKSIEYCYRIIDVILKSSATTFLSATIKIVALESLLFRRSNETTTIHSRKFKGEETKLQQANASLLPSLP